MIKRSTRPFDSISVGWGGNRVVAEPTGNVAPRIAGERYEGGKLVDVAGSSMAALDCTTQGSPVPATR